MPEFVSARTTTRREESTRPAPCATAAVPAVLHMSGVDRRLRPTIESVLCLCVPSPSVLTPHPGEDLWDTRWFTRWERQPGGLRCRELMSGTEEELTDLEEVLGALASEHGFSARLDRIDAHRASEHPAWWGAPGAECS